MLRGDLMSTVKASKRHDRIIQLSPECICCLALELALRHIEGTCPASFWVRQGSC